MKHNPGIGATEDLSLRVSIATLVRVVFKHPRNGEQMLALERKATLLHNEVMVMSQPFGGAIRILDLDAIHDLIGNFRFDSERSYAEQDFRLFIRPSDWSAVREFCIQHFSHFNDSIIETNPTREMTEEFADALKVELQPNYYDLKPTGMVIEDSPAPTENYYVRAAPTVRVYHIFEAIIKDSSLSAAILKNSEVVSDLTLEELALADKQSGGRGWANAVLALPLKPLIEHYFSKSQHELKAPIHFETNLLDETVPAILDEIPVPKYQRL